MKELVINTRNILKMGKLHVLAQKLRGNALGIPLSCSTLRNDNTTQPRPLQSEPQIRRNQPGLKGKLSAFTSGFVRPCGIAKQHNER